MLAAASGPLALPARTAVPESLAEIEGRGPGAPGSAGAELAAGGSEPLRFAAPAGGAAQLVLYLAAVPGPAGLELRGSAALASLLGVPGEIRLGELAGLYGLATLDAPLETTPQPVPEPSALALLALGLGALARVARRRASCHPAGRWSGPPQG